MFCPECWGEIDSHCRCDEDREKQCPVHGVHALKDGEWEAPVRK